MNEETELTPQEEIVTDLAAKPDIIVSEPEAEPAAPAPAPKAKPKPAPRTASPVVSGNATDTVHLSACVYKNTFARKSLSVHHLQRRLTELGYGEAGADRDGWYGDLTASAVTAWQVANKKNATGRVTLDDLKEIFAEDPYIEVAE